MSTIDNAQCEVPLSKGNQLSKQLDCLVYELEHGRRYSTFWINVVSMSWSASKIWLSVWNFKRRHTRISNSDFVNCQESCVRDHFMGLKESITELWEQQELLLNKSRQIPELGLFNLSMEHTLEMFQEISEDITIGWDPKIKSQAASIAEKLNRRHASH